MRIESVCLDCGEPVSVDVKDGTIENVEPEGTLGHVSVPFARWIFNIPYA